MADYIRVSELNRLARQVLEACEPLSALIVLGEVSNFTLHRKSGHCYFTLKDGNAAVKAVMFRDKARLLGFAPQDGMQVLAWGRATLFERDGAFQFYVEYMRPFGVGAAQQALDALKKKLAAEGLFDQSRKRPLPPMPRCIGVVTSQDGAAIRDVCSVVSRRWPLCKLLVAPVNVQGAEAERDIVAGIRAMDADARTDLILVTRGGGSRENLWVFNSELVARAAAACRKPLVSGVGHEIDYTVLDYIADCRAPTPSAAAELCVPDIAVVRQDLLAIQRNLQKEMQTRLDLWYNTISEIEKMLARQSPGARLPARRQAVDAMRLRLQNSAQGRLRAAQSRLEHAAAMANTLSPYAVLGRGYAFVTAPDGTQLPVEALRPGQTVTVHGRRNWAECTVERTGEGEKQP